MAFQISRCICNGYLIHFLANPEKVVHKKTEDHGFMVHFTFIFCVRSVVHLHVYLYKADYRAVEESGYEEDDKGEGCGPQAVELIFLQGIICAVEH